MSICDLKLNLLLTKVGRSAQPYSIKFLPVDIYFLYWLASRLELGSQVARLLISTNRSLSHTAKVWAQWGDNQTGTDLGRNNLMEIFRSGGRFIGDKNRSKIIFSNFFHRRRRRRLFGNNVKQTSSWTIPSRNGQRQLFEIYSIFNWLFYLGIRTINYFVKLSR